MLDILLILLLTALAMYVGTRFLVTRTKLRAAQISKPAPTSTATAQESTKNELVDAKPSPTKASEEEEIETLPAPQTTATTTSTNTTSGSNAPVVTAPIATNAEEQAYIEKRIRTQQQTMQAYSKKGGSTIDFSKERTLPPGQKLTKRWTVLDLGLKPNMNMSTWNLRLSDGQKSKLFSLKELIALGTVEFTSDFHCYTGWTAVDLKFTGIPFPRIVSEFAPSPSWKYLFQVGADGYTCSVPREGFERENIYLTYLQDGLPLCKEHGTIRLINASLYGSKSAKFLIELYFMDELPEDAGFWESRGVHLRGDVWKEERFNRERKATTGTEAALALIQNCNGRTLDLSGLDLDELPEEIYSLTALRTLNLNTNKLHSIPTKLFTSCTKLKTLTINANDLTEWPEGVHLLPKIRELWLCDNKLTIVPDEVTTMKSLAVLGIDTNFITHIPEGLVDLPNLFAIFADRNELKELYPSWAKRYWRALMFSKNPIAVVPTEWCKLQGIQFLGLYHVPGIPDEICENGTEGLITYLREKHHEKLLAECAEEKEEKEGQ